MRNLLNTADALIDALCPGDASPALWPVLRGLHHEMQGAVWLASSEETGPGARDAAAVLDTVPLPDKPWCEVQGFDGMVWQIWWCTNDWGPYFAISWVADGSIGEPSAFVTYVLPFDYGQD